MKKKKLFFFFIINFRHNIWYHDVSTFYVETIEKNNDNNNNNKAYSVGDNGQAMRQNEIKKVAKCVNKKGPKHMRY